MILKATLTPPTGLPLASLTTTRISEVPVFTFIIDGSLIISMEATGPDIMETSFDVDISVPSPSVALAVIVAIPITDEAVKVATALPSAPVTTEPSIAPKVVASSMVWPATGPLSSVRETTTSMVDAPSATRLSAAGVISSLFPLNVTLADPEVSPDLPIVTLWYAVTVATPPVVLVNVVDMVPAASVTAVYVFWPFENTPRSV